MSKLLSSKKNIGCMVVLLCIYILNTYFYNASGDIEIDPVSVTHHTRDYAANINKYVSKITSEGRKADKERQNEVAKAYPFGEDDRADKEEEDKEDDPAIADRGDKIKFKIVFTNKSKEANLWKFELIDEFDPQLDYIDFDSDASGTWSVEKDGDDKLILIYVGSETQEGDSYDQDKEWEQIKPDDEVSINLYFQVVDGAEYSKKDDKYTGHAGGITVAGEYLWVASGRKLYGYKVQEILDFINDKEAKVSDKNEEYIPNSLKIPDKDLIAVNIFKVDSKASFVSFDGKYLWTGDFVMTVSSYKPVEHHTTNKYGRKTWIAGYKTDSTGMPTSSETYSYKDGEDDYSDVHKPDYIICCRESVQGMTMCDDYVVLSLSFGPTTSKLAFYKTPLNEEPDTITYKTTSGTYNFKIGSW